MTTTISAEKTTLDYLEDHFHLTLVENQDFFQEWQGELPDLTDLEKQRLDRVKASYLNLAKRPMLEDMVKMVVVAPLLDLAGFYLPPFYSTSERAIELLEEDQGMLVRGRIDVLVLQNQFWVIVVESKGAKFSLEPGIPQALAYMLASPTKNKPLFGLVTNGSNFIFLKLIKQVEPLYAFSDELTLRRGHDLYTVLAILKQLSQIVLK